MQTEVVVALIVSGLALISAVVTAVISAKKDELNILRGIIAELKDKVRDIECENKDLKDWAVRLVNQVKAAGLKPEEFIQHDWSKKDKE
jgi:hypothetical protein